VEIADFGVNDHGNASGVPANVDQRRGCEWKRDFKVYPLEGSLQDISFFPFLQIKSDTSTILKCVDKPLSQVSNYGRVKMLINTYDVNASNRQVFFHVQRKCSYIFTWNLRQEICCHLNVGHQAIGIAR
jgi:hypothetical protein